MILLVILIDGVILELTDLLPLTLIDGVLLGLTGVTDLVAVLLGVLLGLTQSHDPQAEKYVASKKSGSLENKDPFLIHCVSSPKASSSAYEPPPQSVPSINAVPVSTPTR